MYLFVKSKKILSLITVLAMSLSIFSTVWAAESPKDDLEGHWAEANLRKWVQEGLLTGYEDGTYKADRQITRAEMISLINRSFQLKEKAEISFTDLESSNWSYDQIAIAVQAGYVKGYEDGSIRWNKPVTREEAASMVASLLKLELSGEEGLDAFKDAASISAWSKPAVAALVKEKVIKGYLDGTFAPKGKVTRAETVTILENALNVVKPAMTYSAAGVYGPETGTETIKGNVVISAPGVTLRNLVIEGNLTLTAAVGEGDIYLNKVNVSGKTSIAGGGENSIHLKDSVFVQIIVNKKDGTIRIVAEGATSVKSVTIQSSAKLEEDGVTGVGFTKVELASELPAGSTVRFLGTFEDVNILAKSIRVDVTGGSIGSLSVDKSALAVSIDLNAAAKIVQLVLDAAAKLMGQGAIENAVINKDAGSTTFEKKPTQVSGDGAPAVNPEVPSTGGGSGGSGGNGNGGVTPPTDPPEVVPPTEPTDPTDNVYRFDLYDTISMTAVRNMVNVNANNQAVDQANEVVLDPYYFSDKPYYVVGLALDTNNGIAYKGNVRIQASIIDTSDGGTSEGIQWFAYNDANDSWTDVLKAGFGAAEGQTIDSLINDLGNANKWYLFAQEGTYTIKLQLVDTENDKVVLDSSEMTVKAYDTSLASIDFGGYELKQRSNRGEVIGTGFNPDIHSYEVIIPNAVEEVVLIATASNAKATLKVLDGKKEHQINNEEAVTLSIPAGTQNSMLIIPQLESMGGQGYSVWVKRRAEHPVEVPNKLDPTDVIVSKYTVAFRNVKQGVTANVYGSETGNDLLGSAAYPTNANSPAEGYAYVDMKNQLPLIGTIWVSWNDPSTGESERIAIRYNVTPIPKITSIDGLNFRLFTEAEIAKYNETSYIDAKVGFTMTFNNDLLPESIKDYAYFGYSWTKSNYEREYVFDQLIPYGTSTMVPNAGATTFDVYTNDLGNYYTICFYDKYDSPLGYFVFYDTPAQP